MKIPVLVLAFILSSFSAWAGEHIISERKPAGEGSPLEFSIVARGKKCTFMLSYVPGSERGDLREVQLFLKEKKRGNEELAAWSRPPYVKQIGVFRMTWKDTDRPFSKLLSFAGDEVERMVAIVAYWKDQGSELYIYPMAEVFREEANQPSQRNAGSRSFSDDQSAFETHSSLGPRG